VSKIQIIRDDRGSPAFAVVPWAEYVRITGDDAMDAADTARAEAALTEPGRYPADIVRRLVAGENAIKVFREWRRLSQEGLAKRSGIAKQYVSQLETGHRKVGRRAAVSLAKALGISIEELLTE